MLSSTTLLVSHGQYWVKPSESFPPTPPAEFDDATLIYPVDDEDGGFYATPGTFFGPIELTMQVGDDIVEQDPAAWEIVNDVEVPAPGVDLVVVTTGAAYTELPSITTIPGQPVKVRLYAAGVTQARDIGEFEPDAVPVERHLLQVRPG